MMTSRVPCNPLPYKTYENNNTLWWDTLAMAYDILKQKREKIINRDSRMMVTMHPRREKLQ